MANEITTTTANDITYPSIIEPVLMAVASEISDFLGTAREFSLVGEPGSTIDVPRPQTTWGSVPDDGAGVDTEYDATQGTALSNIAWGTDKVSGTAAEYGIQHEVTDNVAEDSISGIDVMSAIEGQMMHTLILAILDDFAALFAGLSQSVGSTGVDLTIAQLLASQVGIRTRGNKAPNGVVFVLDNQQADDVEAALIATNAAQAVYASAADRLLGVLAGPNNGMTNGQVMSFRGYPVWASGITDTANAGADVVGACYVPSGPGNDPFATFGMVWKRLFRIEFDRDISKRTTKMVTTTRVGVFELTDGSGTKIVTDA